MPWVELLWAAPVALMAGLMRGFAGFGSGMLMAPFFIHLFGPVSTIILITVLEMVVTVQLLPSVYRHIDWSLVLPMGTAAALAMPAGTTLLLTLNPRTVSICIGVIIILFCLALIKGWRYRGRRPWSLTAGIGALSGILMALTSLGNPPVVLYLMSTGTPPVSMRANFTAYFGLTLAALVVWMSLRGLFALEAVLSLLLLLPIFVVGAALGARGFRAANDALYRRVALTTLCIAGVFALIA
ncbi:MAG: sulfite exporter TauE/SafE family protein [Pseudomonadota bacterium]|nr:sulfite exporter TauE/SafE family protein [Pseudomonadota bacterium]